MCTIYVSVREEMKIDLVKIDSESEIKCMRVIMLCSQTFQIQIPNQHFTTGRGGAAMRGTSIAFCGIILFPFISLFNVIYCEYFLITSQVLIMFDQS